MGYGHGGTSRLARHRLQDRPLDRRRHAGQHTAPLARGDSRLSLEERYPSHDDYVSKVTAAANGLARDRLLTEEDVAAYVKKAQATPLE